MPDHDADADAAHRGTGAAGNAGRRADPARLLAAPALIAAVVLGAAPFLAATLRANHALEFPLDDAYIFLQYARQLAHGRPFEYFPGAGYTSGCTSVLFPFLLVPGFWLGLDGLALVPYVWTLAMLLVAACAWTASRLGARAAGEPGRWFAPALLLANAAWWWGALSGLEIGLFTLLALLALELTFAESGTAAPAESRARGRALWITCALLGLARPEGLLVAALAIGAALLRPQRRLKLTSWLQWGAALLPCLAIGLLNRHYTGTFAPNTAISKSVALLPRATPRAIVVNAVRQLAALVDGLLHGWNGYALLPFGAVLAALALGWLAWRALADRGRPEPLPWLLWLGAIGASLASALTARWPGQFYRYDHPALGLTAVAGGAALGAIVAALRARAPGALRLAVPVTVAAAVAFAAARQLPRWSEAFGRAAWEIHHQQVATAEWIAANLPARDRLMMNDVGAMAYLPQRPVFDLCGLVTNHQARIWAEGTGAVFEKLERIAPSDRVDHLVVYADWFALPALLGRTLHEEALAGTLTVAGGRVAGVYEPDWRWLGRGARPGALPADAAIADGADVADLDDEGAHHYAFTPPAHQSRTDPGTIVRFGRAAAGDSVADGGRVIGRGEAFDVTLAQAGEAMLIARVADAGRLDVTVDGRPAGALESAAAPAATGGADFAEPALALGGGPLAAGRHHVEIRSAAPAPYRSFHYWLLLRPPSSGR